MKHLSLIKCHYKCKSPKYQLKIISTISRLLDLVTPTNRNAAHAPQEGFSVVRLFSGAGVNNSHTAVLGQAPQPQGDQHGDRHSDQHSDQRCCAGRTPQHFRHNPSSTEDLERLISLPFISNIIQIEYAACFHDQKCSRYKVYYLLLMQLF